MKGPYSRPRRCALESTMRVPLSAAAAVVNSGTWRGRPPQASPTGAASSFKACAARAVPPGRA